MSRRRRCITVCRVSLAPLAFVLAVAVARGERDQVPSLRLRQHA
ncbi:hypothetical protein RM550_28605 [Streptomyces sp. DSM 41527]|uniref:Uncharacterized protein n=1 Tax=Streptomyces mooreae TaxID=3075523 RepID=A0ABU2TFD0_9ACTN|nr:hypothetical protein [Streptomyces sp. DSM 41527]MDT0459630.1 hypothetical protein [Streptomyces sp. DSM 41527]